MTCPAPERMIELLDAGIESTSPEEATHLGACDACLDAWAAIASGDALLRATPRVRAASRGLVAAAAAVLLSIMALILLRPSPAAAPARQESTQDLVPAFLEGKAGAREKLLRRGLDPMLPLLEARARCPQERRNALADLIFDLKKGAAADDARAAFALMEHEHGVTCDNWSLANALAFWAGVKDEAFPSAFFDPSLLPEMQGKTVKIDAPSSRAMLDQIAEQLGLDWDFRYGLLFVSRPDRLWAPPATVSVPLTEAQAKAAREWIAKFRAESIEERDQAAADLRKLGPSVVPVLEEGARSPDAETAGRCAGLVAEFQARGRGTLPTANFWTTQKLGGDDKALAEGFRQGRSTFALKDADLRTILDLLARIGRVKFRLDPPGLLLVLGKATLAVRNIPNHQILAMLTLPLGLDVRIEKGEFVIYRR